MADGGWFSDRIVGTRKANAVSGPCCAGGDILVPDTVDGPGDDSDGHPHAGLRFESVGAGPLGSLKPRGDAGTSYASDSMNR